MHRKIFILSLALLLILPGVISTTGGNWDDLDWINLSGSTPAPVNSDPEGGNIPNPQRYLDIIGGGTGAHWPGRYAHDDDFICYELKVAREANKDGQWMVLFFRPGVTTLNPQGNFNNDVFLVGGLKKSGSTMSVVLATVSGGHNLTEVETYGADYYEVLTDENDILVRWKIPLTDLLEYITEPVYYTLATGIGNNQVPNRDWFGWAMFTPPAELYTLDLEVSPEGSGTATGAGQYEEGAEVAMVAAANDGWVFVNWTDADGIEVSDQEEFTYTMPAEDTTLTANFEAEAATLYTLDLEVSPDGSGTVSGAGQYEEGTEVELIAEANPGWVFVNWTDADGIEVSDQEEFTYTMPAEDTVLTANFEAEAATLYTLDLEVSPDDSGTVTGAGQYEEGAEVELTAAANVGWVFVNWTDAGGIEVSDQEEFTYTMPAADITLTANFEAEAATLYTLDLEVSPEGSGTATGAGQYEGGAEVELVAAANDGWVFVNWTDADGIEVSDQEEFTYTMPAEDTVLTANFEAEAATLYTLDLEVSPDGSGTVSGAGQYEEGTEVELIAEANPGWVFVNWTDADGIEVSDQEEFTYTMPAENTILKANFKAEELPVTGTNIGWMTPLGFALIMSGLVLKRRYLGIQ